MLGLYYSEMFVCVASVGVLSVPSTKDSSGKIGL